MQNKFLLPVALLSFLMIGAFGWKLQQDKQRVYQLTLTTGTKTGNYHPFGQALAEVIVQQNPHIRIQVIETEGAEENMRKLEANEAQLAIVQNDTAAVPSARVIAALFKEVWIFLTWDAKLIIKMPRTANIYFCSFQNSSSHTPNILLT